MYTINVCYNMILCIFIYCIDLLAPGIRNKLTNAQRLYRLWAGELCVCVCVCVCVCGNYKGGFLIT